MLELVPVVAAQGSYGPAFSHLVSVSSQLEPALPGGSSRSRLDGGGEIRDSFLLLGLSSGAVGKHLIPKSTLECVSAS